MFSVTGNALFWLAFIFLATTIGSGLTFIFPNKLTEKIFPVLSGFSVGVMIAASVWSLLIPSIERSAFSGAMKVFEATLGFVLGGAFMAVTAIAFPGDSAEKSNLRLFTAITMHNIPEGLAVGFAFGGAALGALPIAAAISVAFGIGIQNIPEGSAISLSSRKTMRKGKAFFFGMLSGAVEPIAGILGYFFSEFVAVLLPYLMSFAAGAMVFASVSDLLPDALAGGKLKTGAGVTLGFLIMMILDVILG